MENPSSKAIYLSPADLEAIQAILENPPAATPELEKAMAEFRRGEFVAGQYRSFSSNAVSPTDAESCR